MKTIAILGSARRGGNTETLMKEALRGAGKRARIYALAEMSFIGCQGCRACRIEGAKGCIWPDDMRTLYAEMKKADAIILGSPIYYGEVTGQMKSFMDRWYALRDKDRRLRILPGKKVLFIIVQGAPGKDRYAETVKRLEKVLTSYEMKPEILVAPGLENKGDAKKDPDIMRKAFMAGAHLARKA